MHAKKRFGQHFLVLPEVVQRIVLSARVQPDERVLEVGPGPGILTEALLKAGAALVTVELDRDMIEGLKQRWPDLVLHQADAMRINLEEICPGEGWKAVSNLPYNIAAPLLLRLLDHPRRFSTLVLMFQKEMADRIQAPPDSDAYGSLSVQVQARAAVRRVMNLPPTAFRPPPKVDSTVLHFQVFPEAQVGSSTPDHFDRVVRAAFAQRRKTLLNSLSSLYPRAELPVWLEKAEVLQSRRAETLSLEEFRRLAAVIPESAASL